MWGHCGRHLLRTPPPSSAATTAANQRITVVLWQMTISKDNKHSAKAEVLASILAKCKGLLQQPFDVVFLYEVEDISGFKFQPYVKQKGVSYEKMPSEMIKGLKDIKQYAIKFKSSHKYFSLARRPRFPLRMGPTPIPTVGLS